MSIFLQSDGVNLWYFKLRLFNLTEALFEILKVNEIGLQRYRNVELVAKTQILCRAAMMENYWV